MADGDFMKRTLLRHLLTLGMFGFGVFTLAQQGALEPTDPQLDSGEHYDVHAFDGTADSTLTISLTSDAFDVYLFVLNPDNTPLIQIDDSEGHGLNVQTSVTLPSTGQYTVVVTSALPDETGAYTLSMQDAGTTPPAPVATQAEGFSGTFSDGNLTVTLQGADAAYSGQFSLGAQTYPATARANGSTLTGSFQSGGSSFDFSAVLAGDSLTLQSGGMTYTLTRQASNPLAGGTVAPPAAPAPAPTPSPVQPVARIQPRPGYITGTVFDTQGRPLPGAGVLITGTTFEQGQRTSFEATTDENGTYAVRVPDGRYEAKAWTDVTFNGAFFSRLLHPLSGTPSTQVDSTVGGNLDFQWRLTGLTAYSTPPGSSDTDFYGASIDLSYCGLPANAYCSADYNSFPTTPIAPEGSTVRLTLTPTGPLIDGTQGQVLTFDIPVGPQLPDYPYGTAANRLPDYPDGGGGRTVLGTIWQYHSKEFNDIPLGTYSLTATAVLPNGSTQAMKLGLDYNDVNHASLPITFSPWEDYHARSYIGGGITQLTVHIRD